jgi:hypothetical protein
MPRSDEEREATWGTLPTPGEVLLMLAIVGGFVALLLGDDEPPKPDPFGDGPFVRWPR